MINDIDKNMRSLSSERDGSIPVPFGFFVLPEEAGLIMQGIIPDHLKGLIIPSDEKKAVESD